MPKMKTKRGAAKRFRKTGGGKFKRGKAYHSHILSSKDRKRKRRLRKTGYADKTNHRKIQRQMPYA
jgi:large subunit ribosomal protein L35